MDRRTFLGTLTLFAAPLGADAQPASKTVPRIGYLSGETLSAVRLEAFRRGLRELGYVEHCHRVANRTG